MENLTTLIIELDDDPIFVELNPPQPLIAPVAIVADIPVANAATSMQELNENESCTDFVPKGIGLFSVATANQWLQQAALKPVPKKLFDVFWYEGELCNLFSDTNRGKSILGVQIGDSISRGVSVGGTTMTAARQPVLYYDFELSDKQFENRYSNNFANHYGFDDYLIRLEINPNGEYSGSFDAYLYKSLEKSIIETGAKILIIDNLTYLKDGTEQAKFALPLMKHLQQLKKKYSLSILTLAHTPKRDSSKPLTQNDLQGSKMLMNFMDAAFAIGDSKIDSKHRYLKQIKCRSSEIKFDADNVAVFQITKPDNFLQFEYVGTSTEREHLKEPSANDSIREERAEKIRQAAELRATGESYEAIGNKLGVDKATVCRWLKKD